MKKYLLGAIVSSAIIVSGAVVPLKSWSLPAGIEKSETEIKFSAGL